MTKRKKKYTKLSSSTLDKMWAKKVKELANYKCEFCGATENLSSHHIQPRRLYSVRWYLPNGVCLCEKCHTKGLYSAHKNPLFFYRKIIVFRALAWYLDLINRTVDETDWKSKLKEIKETLE